MPPNAVDSTEALAGSEEVSQVGTESTPTTLDHGFMNDLIRGEAPDVSEIAGEGGDESEQASESNAAPQDTSTVTTETSQPSTLTREDADKLIADAERRALERANADLDRRVQAETDRREAARKRRESEEKRRKLRDEDPLAFAEYDAQQEEEAQKAMSTVEQEQERKLMVQTVMQNSGALYDKHVLDPFVHTLPQAVAEQVFKEVDPDGLEGRAKLVQRAMELLPAYYAKEAREKAKEELRKNPAFIKEILRDLRGEEEDPEIINGTVAVTPFSTDMNSLIRRGSGRYVPNGR